jgi:hypothetical protein
MTKLFGELPEEVLDSIFEFLNDGPVKIVYDAKKKKFINKINDDYFILLKKALEFKISNPPHRTVDGWEWGGDGEEEEEIDLTDIGEDITETLIFKYPLKLRLRDGCFDDFHIDDGYLSLTFCYSRDFYKNEIKKCSISIPEYYLLLRSKSYNFYKEQMQKKLSKKQMYRVRNLVKGFSTVYYGEDSSEF